MSLAAIICLFLLLKRKRGRLSITRLKQQEGTGYYLRLLLVQEKQWLTQPTMFL